MKKFLTAMVVAAGLVLATGCEAAVYDVVPPTVAVNACGAIPADGVIVEPCTWYRVVYVGGVPYQYYYTWVPGVGWGYHHYAYPGGFGYRRGGWHGGGHFGHSGGHFGGGHGGHR